jgi:predicted amidophosphoribosyltransferase
VPGQPSGMSPAPPAPPPAGPPSRPDRALPPWGALLAAVLPVRCAGCSRADVPLCRACARALRVPPGALPDLLVHPRAPGCPPTAAGAAYAGPVRAVVTGWKERGRHDVLRHLSAVLAEAVLAALAGALPAALAAAGPRRAPGPLLLVPVPSARRAVRRRGQDLVAALARAAASRLRARGLDVVAAPALRLVRRVRDQAGLGAAARAANVAGASGLRRRARVRGRLCVVVDDVVTTGASLAEAARALTEGGALVVAGATVAATSRHHAEGRRRTRESAGVEWSPCSAATSVPGMAEPSPLPVRLPVPVRGARRSPCRSTEGWSPPC